MNNMIQVTVGFQTTVFEWVWHVIRVFLFVGAMSSLKNVFLIALRHYHYKDVPGPDRDNFFKGHLDIVTKYRRRDGHINTWLYTLHLDHGPIFVFWLYRMPRIIVSDAAFAKDLLLHGQPPGTEHTSVYEVYNHLSDKVEPLLDGDSADFKSVLTGSESRYRSLRRSLYLRFLHRNSIGAYLPAMQAVSDGMIMIMNKVERVDLRGVIATYVHRLLTQGLLSMDDQYCSSITTGCKSSLNTFFSKVEMAAKITILNRRISDKEGVVQAELGPEENVEREVIEIRRIIYEHIQVVKQVMRRSSVSGGMETPSDLLTGILGNCEWKLPSEVLVNDLVAFILMGRETLTTLVSQTFHNILTHRHIYIRLLSEIDLHLGRRGVTLEDLGILNKMTYLDAVIKETLRLHPPRPTIPAKVTRRRVTFDKVAFKRPPSGTVSVSVYNIHRSPGIWEDPLTFNPDRFLDPALLGVLRRPCNFFPFSCGARACIGKDFSLVVAKVIIVSILAMFDVDLEKSHVRYSDYISMRIATPLVCNLVKTRKNVERFGG